MNEKKDKEYISGKSETGHEVFENMPFDRSTTRLRCEIGSLESYKKHEAKKVESCAHELLHFGAPLTKRGHSPLKRGDVFVLRLTRNRTKSPHHNCRRKYGIDADQAHH
jgi:hypothetical protein